MKPDPEGVEVDLSTKELRFKVTIHDPQLAQRLQETWDPKAGKFRTTKVKPRPTRRRKGDAA